MVDGGRGATLQIKKKWTLRIANCGMSVGGGKQEGATSGSGSSGSSGGRRGLPSPRNSCLCSCLPFLAVLVLLAWCAFCAYIRGGSNASGVV